MLRKITEEQIINFLRGVSSEQLEIVEGPYFDHGENISFGWIENEVIVGCIRYCIQEIGVEQKTPPIRWN